MRIMTINHPIVMFDIADRLRALGHQVVPCGRMESIDELQKRRDIDLVFDVQVDPPLNDACGRLGIKKISWLIDWVINPNSFRRIGNPDVVIILSPFRELRDKFASAGYRNVHHFPPGINLARFKYTENKSKNIVFAGDSISAAKYEYPALKADCAAMKADLNENGQAMVDRFIGDLERILDEQAKSPGKFIAPALVGENLFITEFPLYKEYNPEAFPYMLGKEATSRLRVKLLSMLVPFGLEIYGPESWLDFPEFAGRYKGAVSYDGNLPQVIGEGRVTANLSRVFNLAICRVMESTATGSMLITENRDHTRELFKPGMEAVYYDSLDEIPELVARYLADDDARLKITRAARARVEREYDMEKLLKKALELAVD